MSGRGERVPLESDTREERPLTFFLVNLVVPFPRRSVAQGTLELVVVLAVAVCVGAEAAALCLAECGVDGGVLCGLFGRGRVRALVLAGCGAGVLVLEDHAGWGS